jgi:ESS family glutamate:Na+ symporter
MPAALNLPVWLTLLLALPVLWLGSALVRRIRALDRFSIPAPVVGGLLFAIAVLAANYGGWSIRCETGTGVKAWTWLVTAEPDWQHGPVKSANLPFLAAFFASVGLGASWALVRQAGRMVLIFLAAVSALAVLQNVLGLALAWLLGVSPLLGLVCGSMSMTGGHATTLGFAAEFERAGLTGAQSFGMAAATLGLVSGALLSGPVGRSLIRQHGLRSAAPRPTGADPVTAGAQNSEHQTLLASPGSLVASLLLLVFCLKAGAWLSYGLQQTGLVFPVFVGTLLAGVIVRFGLDRWSPAWFKPASIEKIATVALGIFLATAMMTLNLRELAHVAGPMLVILGGQILLTVTFARWVTFPLMGRDYDAAVMAGGHCGFGLGSTATAVAGMKALVETGGAAPRAFLIVPLVGGFLVDLANALNLTTFISLVRPN